MKLLGSLEESKLPLVPLALSPALAYLRRFNQFIVWHAVPDAGGEKPRKIPCDYRTGQPANAHDPAVWTDFDTASGAAAFRGAEYGVGFVLTREARVAVLDYDNALMPDGNWHPTVLELLQHIPLAARELSHSGAGAHSWCIYRGELPANDVTTRNINGLKVELFLAKKFIALGNQETAAGDVSVDYTAELSRIINDYFPQVAEGNSPAWQEGHELGWELPEDEELIRRALRMGAGDANVAFGKKVSFRDLWEANEAALSKHWPAEDRAYDASSADMALASKLAWLTGNDCPRIERLMWQSALKRDKWEKHKNYLTGFTIPRALVRDGGFYDPKYRERSSPTAQAPGLQSRGTDRYLGPDGQLKHFAGCVYIQSQHRVFVPNGEILKPEVFKVAYGGYTFMLDSVNIKTTRDAFEAFTQSQCNEPAIAFGTCFKPLSAPGTMVERNGQRFVNTYVPVRVDRKQGDPKPILDLLRKLLPDDRDRTILLSYMAAVVQHVGVKFQWAPLIQGIEGNGKSMLSSCVEQAVGHRYTHWPKAKELGSKFNDWLQGKVFYAVEDIYVPDAKTEILEDLKPMITGGRIEIQKKGVDQFSADICGNFIFNSNFQDAIRVTDKSRRFCILFTAQQTEEDLIRDGMKNTDYFPKIWKWLRDQDGFAIMNEFLHTYQIPAEFNPAGDCFRAPETSTTHLAIAASLGSVEQDILEAVDEGRPGFCGGWISSEYVKRLPRAEKLGPKKRRQILEGMGYMLHPQLKDGRVNHPVSPDNTKTCLYIRRDNAMLAQISNQAAIAKNYEDANRVFVQLPFGQTYAK